MDNNNEDENSERLLPTAAVSTNQQMQMNDIPGPTILGSSTSHDSPTPTQFKLINNFNYHQSPQLNHHHHTPNNTNNNNNNVNRIHRPSHQRTRSVDLHLTYSAATTSPTSASSALQSSSSSSSSSNRRQALRLATVIEEKVSKLYYKHGLFCSRHPFWLILLSLTIVTIVSYQIVTFRGIFGSSYDVYISSSHRSSTKSEQDPSFSLPKNEPNPQLAPSTSTKDSTNALMEHLYFWPDSYVRNELDDDQMVPPWFQMNQTYAYVQQIYIRTSVIPWNDDMQLVDAVRAPFQLIFEMIEAIQNFQYKNEFNETITMNDVCFQIFEPTLSKRYAHITKHLPSYSCLLLSPASLWHGDQIRFQQDSDILTTLLKFQDCPASPVPSGTMHEILFGVTFDETGIRRTYGRNRQRTISYSITLILRKNVSGFVEALRTFLYKRYPVSMMNLKKEPTTTTTTTQNINNNETAEEDGGGGGDDGEEDFLIDYKTKHIYFHNTFTYNYLLPLILIYAIVCLYMNFSVRKIEIIRKKWLYSLCTLITILMSLFMSFGICFRLRFHSVLVVNRLLPYFVAGISFENMLVLTKSVLANPHLDSKVRVAQALSKEGVSITKNLLTELILLSIGSFTFMPFFQECCKIAAVCFLSDFFIQITFFTPFLSSLIHRRINEQSIISNAGQYLDKQQHPSYYPRNIYARPGEPVQQKTPKRLRFIYFLAQIRLVQRCFILLLSACIGLAIYNAYLVLEQNTYIGSNNNNKLYEQQSESPKQPMILMEPNLNQTSKTNNRDEIITSSSSSIATAKPLNGDRTPRINRLTETETFDVTDKLKSFMKLLSGKDSASAAIASPISLSSSSVVAESAAQSNNNPNFRILFSDDNPLPKAFANHHWTNLFSLYNISLVGRFISIMPPILLSVPITPDQAKRVRNAADSDYYTLKRFIPMKFTNGEYVVSDDDDFDRFERRHRLYWSKDDLHLIIGLWIPCLLIFVYLIYQLYRCFCTRNYAEWRSQMANTNPLARFGSFVKRAALNSDSDVGGGRKQEKLIRIDISLLNFDREKESFVDEKHYLLNNQDVELISTNLNTSLVATGSMSGDVRCYDALTCESLAIIKRSKLVDGGGDFSVYRRTNIPELQKKSTENDRQNEDDGSNENSTIVVKTEGNILRTLFYGIHNDDDDSTAGVDPNMADDTATTTCLENLQEFRPIWSMDIFDRFVLVGCGRQDGRLEAWNAYTGQLAWVYYSESFLDQVHQNSNSIDDLDDDEKKKKNDQHSYAITVIKATYWGVALARINGQLEMLELEKLNEDNKYQNRFKQRSSSIDIIDGHGYFPTGAKPVDLHYRCKYRLQAHRQPISRMEIIDSLEDEEFLKVFGSRGCLITGSMDTTLKVFAMDNFKLMYTFNGHCGSIVSTCIDPYSTASALSGCQLGQLCVWDLNTGTCIFSMQAHSDAEVLSITTSPLYYVTAGTDNNICIWDRYSGHLIHTIHNQHTICKNMVFLEPYILVTARDAELVIWDCNDARSICVVPLAQHHHDQQNTSVVDHQRSSTQPEQQPLNKWTRSYQTRMIKNLQFSYQRKALICDYGDSLCIINNPFEMKKLD